MQENYILSLSGIGLSTVLCVRSRWASSKAFIIISLNWQNNDSLLPSVQIVAQSVENDRVAGHSLVFNSCQHTPLKGPMVSFEGKEGRINVSTGWLTIPVLPLNLWTRFLQPYHSANVLRDSQTPLAISKRIIVTNRAMSTRLEKLLSDLFVPLSTLTARVLEHESSKLKTTVRMSRSDVYGSRKCERKDVYRGLLRLHRRVNSLSVT